VLSIFAEVLNESESENCCENSILFQAGGNSLLLTPRASLSVSLGLPQLFASATVAQLAALVDRTTAASQSQSQSSTASAGSKGSHRIHVICLQEGDAHTGEAPLVLVNPAGASGLW
jgi:hypothetical protein